MMPTLIETHGLDELIARMKAYPLEMHKAMAYTMATSLIVLWENVPAYPAASENSTYDRTGTLGKSLGSDIGGGAGGGEPDIYTIKPIGSVGYEGKFGTSLEYAEYVIGENQAQAHRGRWWQLRTVADRAADKINRLWQMLGDKMAAFLEGHK